MKKIPQSRSNENTTSEENSEKYNENSGQKRQSNCYKKQMNDAKERFFLHSSKHYLDYLKNYAKKSDPYRLYKKASDYFRPIRYIVKFFRWFVIALTWIQASALLLLFAVLILAALPLALLLFTLVSLLVRIDAWKKLQKDKKVFESEKVIVFFFSGEVSHFAFSQALDFSREYVVVMVGGRLGKIKELKNKKFANRVEIKDRLYHFHEHYFFLLRNEVFSSCERIFLLY